jgi:hypothetical protein
LLGHLHGIERNGLDSAPEALRLLSENQDISELIDRLGRRLNELWLTEFSWHSLYVFVPIYDLLCELMALHGMAFARHGDEWRVVMSDEESKSSALKDFLMSRANAQS